MCVRLVLLAPGSPAQAKLPVRSWHHLPPSQPYTEDNRALLWGSCDLSVQLVCPYFCHPVRIQLLSLCLFHFLSLSFFFLSFFLWLMPPSGAGYDYSLLTPKTNTHRHTHKDTHKHCWLSLTHLSGGWCVVVSLGPVAPGCLLSCCYC